MALYGVYRGVVLDSNDPSGSGRVKVNVDGRQAWAPVALPAAPGPSAKIQIGATVIVAFERGAPDHPVVLGRVK